MTLFLVICALFPAIALCAYVFKKDRVEKEPLGLLLLLLASGALSCFPAIVLEIFLGDINTSLFSAVAPTAPNGTLYLNETQFYLYQFIEAFFVVALSEEFVKWLFLKRITFENKNFNCLFDGLIYAVFVSLGFAALENVMYVLQYGFQTAVSRAIMSVPGHMFFAVMMGYHYSKWHILKDAKEIEKHLKETGKISPDAREISYKKNMIFSLLLPVATHGFYDFCLFTENTFAFFVVIAFMIFMYIFCFARIKNFSKSDAPEYNYVAKILLRKYPFLTIEDIFN